MGQIGYTLTVCSNHDLDFCMSNMRFHHNTEAPNVRGRNDAHKKILKYHEDKKKEAMANFNRSQDSCPRVSGTRV